MKSQSSCSTCCPNSQIASHTPKPLAPLCINCPVVAAPHLSHTHPSYLQRLLRAEGSVGVVAARCAQQGQLLPNLGMGEGRGELGDERGRERRGRHLVDAHISLPCPRTSARISVVLGDAATAAPCPSTAAAAAAICFLSCASTDMAACASPPHSPARLTTTRNSWEIRA